jgi:hypothetical protein
MIYLKIRVFNPFDISLKNECEELKKIFFFWYGGKIGKIDLNSSQFILKKIRPI